jgi:eukaryotic-like serine/threonine-protein kinase
MRAPLSPVEALGSISRLEDAAERRAAWRQAVTALGQNVRVVGPPPLETAQLEPLLAAARVALETGLVDDLDWIAPGHAAVALYELTAALPPGLEKRMLGRRVFARLHGGTASVFAMVATRMALGKGGSLESPTLRARVALVFDMPIGSTVNADALALTLVCRRATFLRWVAEARTGALHARRMAAKLLEHAAREAVIRAQHGDPLPVTLLTSDEVSTSLSALLADREPLVWRHAAVARGLLAGTDQNLREEIETSLDPALTPTEWRRAAVSLVALIALDPLTALKQCTQLLRGPIAQHDPGIAASMLAGLPRVVEAEPDAAEALLDRVSATDRLDVLEAAAELLSDVAHQNFGRRAAERLRAALDSSGPPSNSARGALVRRALRGMERDPSDTSLTETLRQALVAFEAQGANAAHALALATLANAATATDELVTLGGQDPSSTSRLLSLLSDLDATLLQRGRLWDLLLLNRRPGETESVVPRLEQLYSQLGSWALDWEERSCDLPASATHELVWQRRLRALLHLVDLDTPRNDSDEERDRLYDTRRRAVHILIRSLAAHPQASVHRVLCAALARSLDAAAREGIAEPSDLLLAVLVHVSERESIAAIADASTNPDVRRPLVAYLAFVAPSHPSHQSPPSRAARGGVAQLVQALGDSEVGTAESVVRLSHSLCTGGMYRGEALRQTVLRMGRALESIAAARCLSELVDTTDGRSSPLGDLERSILDLRQMLEGAVRRLFVGSPPPAANAATASASLSLLIEQAANGAVLPDPTETGLCLDALTHGLPEPFAVTIAHVAGRVTTLPASAASESFAIPLERRRTALPDWLLPRRTIGAFYVVRALGSGGGSSVFVARRIEERHDAKARLFALKVPNYDPSTARSLSEQEFLQLFREEASALLALPHHPNLAGFVTFDLAARPKPILVMELIAGTGLDRLLRTRSLSVGKTLEYLGGILDGLAAMHAAGVAHLDLKPSNVILREGVTPVLVDFGLAGRHLRPGCGTLDYCAPEVLGAALPSGPNVPQAADLYAFGAMAFELLTAQTLFEGDDELTLVSHHVSHDGWPEKLRHLAGVAETTELGILLSSCLRADPQRRPSAAEARRRLDALAPSLQDASWPLPLTSR